MKGHVVGKLVLMMGVSLDGMVARPGKLGAGGWGTPPEDPALTARKLGWIRDAGLHLMGRVTYEEMAGFWPHSDDEYAAPISRLRLVDEYRLVVQPVALGDGLPLFAGLVAPLVLDLIEARAYADGAVLHVYRPATGLSSG